MPAVLRFATLAGLLAFAAPAPAFDGVLVQPSPGWRNQGGSLNYAPRPGVFEVVSVDDYDRTVRLRSLYGAEADVHVGDRILDLDRLKPGDIVQVDFFVPDQPGERLSAATIWPLR